jgi:hypothetical protein
LNYNYWGNKNNLKKIIIKLFLFLDAGVKEKFGERSAGIFVDLFAVFVDLVGDKEGFEA